MTAEFGVFFLIAALLVAALQSTYLWPPARKRIAACLPTCAMIQFFCITLALITLLLLRLENDFSVTNVVAHSNRTLPLLYKIVGAWGNHEGSMLLWAWVLALYGMLLIHQREPVINCRLAMAIQAALAVGVLAFILFTSNPFTRLFPPANDGEALNPMLQDIALAMHPPLLYLGYVGFSVVFSLAVGALLMPVPDMRTWADRTHPWILAAWSLLTIGIGLGSWWAYRELGWGGWWFWDPVENASLMPWLAGIALLHANAVLKKRGLLAPWVLLLAIITFGLSLIGTFLVRSGALTSVHSFASDPTRGLFILAYIALVMGSALTLFAVRAHRFAGQESMLPVSREGMIVINNLFVLTACATVVLGTMYPLLAEALSGSKLTVGAPYFNITFLPLMAIPLFFAGLTPFMPWKHASFKHACLRAWPAWGAVFAIVVCVSTIATREITLATTGFALAAWLAAASIKWLHQASGIQGAWAVFFGHIGAACLLAGITGAGLWKQETETHLALGQPITLAGYECVLRNIEKLRANNYDATRATFNIESAGNRVTTLLPEYRSYDIRRMPTNETAIYSTLTGDLYLAIGELSADDKTLAVRVYYVPMIGFIWAGCVLMALGGALGIRRKLL